MAAPSDDVAPGSDVKLRALDEAPVGVTITDPDRPDNPLVYVNDAFEEITGYDRDEVVGRNCRFLQGPDTDADAVAELREGIDARESVVVELLNYRKDGEAFWNEVKVAPLWNDGEVTNYVGFQTDVTARVRAEREVREDRASLEHLVDRLDGLLGDVTEVVVNANGRDEVAVGVCERLAAADTYSFAWLGDVDRAASEVRPRAWHGRDGVDADALAVPTERTDHPIVRAIRTGEFQHVTAAEAAGVVPFGGVSGVAAIPLTYRSTTYGVLVVYTPDPAALNDVEATVLESLGRTVATALSANESRRLIAADQIVTLALETEDRSLFFVDLSARLDGELDYRGAVSRASTPTLFFAADAPTKDVLAAAEAVPGVDGVDVVGDGNGALFEFRVSEESLVGPLADRGGRVREISARNGRARIEVDLPAGADTRGIVEGIQERYPDAEVVRYRERERPPTGEDEFAAAVEDRLTERQSTALQKAYFAGYYDANRRVTGADLAESMGISRATFHQHLRAAERKVFAALLDE